MHEYLVTCQRLGPGADLISVVVSCSADENARRLSGRAEEQHPGSTKLVDADILHAIRQSEEIHRFGDQLGLEIELDTDGMSAVQSAKLLAERIATYHHNAKN